MSEKAVILGSNSFSGAHMVAHCRQQGLDVVGISRGPEIQEAFRPYAWTEGSGSFRFAELDLNHHMPEILSLIESERPSYVFNYAAQGMVAQSWLTPLDWYRTNTLSMVALHDGLRHFDFLQAFVQASTPEVYGSTASAIQEDAPFNPSTPYAISKAACDMNLHAFARTYGFPVVLTRAANVCGPGQQLYRILPRAVLSALTGEAMTLDGGGLSQRAFIHISDVCAATLLAARRRASRPWGGESEIYHLSTETLVTIRQLVESVCDGLQVEFDRLVTVGPPRLGLDAAYQLDSRKARQELGWECRHDLASMVADTVDWVRRYLPALQNAPKAYVHQP